MTLVFQDSRKTLDNDLSHEGRHLWDDQICPSAAYGQTVGSSSAAMAGARLRTSIVVLFGLSLVDDEYRQLDQATIFHSDLLEGALH